MGVIQVPQDFVGTNGVCYIDNLSIVSCSISNPHRTILKLYIVGEGTLAGHMAAITFLRSLCYDCRIRI